jgi:hypothetical protein
MTGFGQLPPVLDEQNQRLAKERQEGNCCNERGKKSPKCGE